MVARLTRALLLVQLLAAGVIYIVIAVGFQINNIALAVAVGMGTVLVVRFIITANNFLLASRYRSNLPSAYRIRRWQSVKLLFSEYRSTMLSSSWTMPFRTFSRRIPDHAEGLPVILVHGYGCNSGYWHAMSKVLSKARIAHYAIDMEPIICGIDDYVPLIHHAIEQACQETGRDKVVIVAHSMGGLAARAYVRRHGTARIAKAITLGSPHRGTALAQFGVGVNTQQMRWTATGQEGIASDWLEELARTEDDEVRRLFVSIYSHHDNIISPQISSHLRGAKNIELSGIGHVQLALSPVVQAHVIREIRSVSNEVGVEANAATADVAPQSSF